VSLNVMLFADGEGRSRARGHPVSEWTFDVLDDVISARTGA